MFNMSNVCILWSWWPYAHSQANRFMDVGLSQSNSQKCIEKWIWTIIFDIIKDGKREHTK